MPCLPPQVIHGRVSGTFRRAVNMFVRWADVWVQPLYVWVRRPDGWVVAWAREPSAVASMSATLVGTTVEIRFTPIEPEAVTAYKVTRDDGSVVALVPPQNPGRLGARTEITVVDSAPTTVSGSSNYTVVAELSDGVSPIAFGVASTDSVSIATAPATLTATYNAAGTVSLSWDASAGAASYRVYTQKGSIGATVTGTTWVDGSPDSTSHEPGTWSVRAVTAGSTTGPAQTSNVLTIAPRPSAPSCLFSKGSDAEIGSGGGTGANGAAVTVSWTRTANTVSYGIEYQYKEIRNGASYSAWYRVATVAHDGVAGVAGGTQSYSHQPHAASYLRYQIVAVPLGDTATSASGTATSTPKPPYLAVVFDAGALDCDTINPSGQGSTRTFEAEFIVYRSTYSTLYTSATSTNGSKRFGSGGGGFSIPAGNHAVGVRQRLVFPITGAYGPVTWMYRGYKPY